MPSRPLHFIWLLDCSGSMREQGKIQSLNAAIREAVPHMRSAAATDPTTSVLLRVVAFGDEAAWHIAQPVPVEQFEWQDVTATGTTALGAALELVAAELDPARLGGNPRMPILALVSDGYPTDDVDRGFAALDAAPLGKQALRVAIGIGEDADEEVLTRFIDAPERLPLRAHDVDSLRRLISWASTATVRASSQLAGAAAAAQALAQSQPAATEHGDDDLVW